MLLRARHLAGNRLCILAGLAVMVCGAATQAAAQQQPAPPLVAMTPLTQLLLTRLQGNLTLDRYRENLRFDFFQMDADADGRLTIRDIDLHELMERIRARSASAMQVLRFDLDGDSFVTEDEIRRGMKYELRLQMGMAAFGAAGSPAVPAVERLQREIDSTVRSIMALDADKDGKVSYAETSNFVSPGGLQHFTIQSGQSARVRTALSLDTQSKGAVTLVDFQAAGEALFRKIDADGNGMVSQQELAESRGQPNAAAAMAAQQVAQETRRKLLAAQQAEVVRKRAEAAEAARVGCEMPAASAKAKIIVLGAYQTEALSSVTLGSQDAVVHDGHVLVEPGDDPLYVVIATYSAMVWQFSGAVDRVERLVMSSWATGPNGSDRSKPPLVGSTGLPRDKISFLSKPTCVSYFSEVPSSQSIQAVAAVREATGREPSGVFSAYSLMGFSIPSGKVESLSNARREIVIEKSAGSLRLQGDISSVIVHAGPSRALDELYRFSPGGLREIDPKTVVASVPVQTYEVFPQQAGLVQLLESGLLKQNRAGEYIVQGKTRFPAGLYGAHSVHFLVLRGVPYPNGDPGHSCVYVEDTGEKKGAVCH